MSARPGVIESNEGFWSLPSRGKVGMISLIVAESAIFTIFIAAYIFYIGKSLNGPSPREILRIPIVTTICLLSSSLTMHSAVAALRRDQKSRFNLFWFLTFALGAIFLAGTAREWHHLIVDEGFTIQTNLFGTTYYSLVSLHASHVSAGLVVLFIVGVLSLAGKVKHEHLDRCEVIALYWHFVDAVWVIVFTVVYMIGR